MAWEKFSNTYDIRNRHGRFLKGIKFRLGKKHSKESKFLMSISRKGKHYSPNTEFKKGMIPWCKGKHLPIEIRKKISEAHKGKIFSINTIKKMRETRIKNKKTFMNKHYRWKGDSATIPALIRRVRIIRGKPSYCERCKTEKSKQFYWINPSRNYIDISKYERVCGKCRAEINGIIQNIY